jgi:hypothetical protein
MDIFLLRAQLAMVDAALAEAIPAFLRLSNNTLNMPYVAEQLTLAHSWLCLALDHVASEADRPAADPEADIDTVEWQPTAEALYADPELGDAEHIPNAEEQHLYDLIRGRITPSE